MKEIFDRVKTHLLAQGERALHGGEPYGLGIGGDGCAYHTQSGLKCAVGCLITEEAYSEELEGELVDDLGVRAALESSGISYDPVTLYMLLDLQSIHDDEAPNRWEHALDNLEYDLFGDTK